MHTVGKMGCMAHMSVNESKKERNKTTRPKRAEPSKSSEFFKFFDFSESFELSEPSVLSEPSDLSERISLYGGSFLGEPCSL
jgi:hypothetical protein